MYVCFLLMTATHVLTMQVVRSVAFSESGDLVAIGANSRTLRLCSTEPLLQDTKR